MSVLNTIASGGVSGITELAKKIVNKIAQDTAVSVVDGASAIIKNRARTPEDSAMSLTEYTKQTTLRSRVYIDDSLLGEDVLPNLVRALHTMYAGLILTALHMSQFVTQGKTVQDLLGTVATESLDPYFDVQNDIATLTTSLEALASNTAAAQTSTPNTQNGQSLSAKDVTLTPTNLVPVGKTLEVEFTNPDNPKASGKLFLTVLMVPYLIPAKIASMFINKDTSLHFLNRFIMWRAGEISFFRDLIFEIDRMNQAHAIAKNDPNKVFYEFMNNVAKKDRATITKNLTQTTANKSHNLANSVMIFSTDAVAKAKTESGIDLHSKGVRERYFKDTYAMAIAVVDPMYHQITLYLNGIDDVGVYTYADFDNKSGDKSNNLDLLKILSQFTAGKAPRY